MSASISSGCRRRTMSPRRSATLLRADPMAFVHPLPRRSSDGRFCLSNNAAERALRCAAVGRRNWTFAGSDAGGRRAAAVYSLIETCTSSMPSTRAHGSQTSSRSCPTIPPQRAPRPLLPHSQPQPVTATASAHASAFRRRPSELPHCLSASSTNANWRASLTGLGDPGFVVHPVFLLTSVQPSDPRGVTRQLIRANVPPQLAPPRKKGEPLTSRNRVVSRRRNRGKGVIHTIRGIRGRDSRDPAVTLRRRGRQDVQDTRLPTAGSGHGVASYGQWGRTPSAQPNLTALVTTSRIATT
jgi:hypothetical protein